MIKVTPLAKQPVIGTSAVDRARARISNVAVPSEPDCDASRDRLGDVFQTLYQTDPKIKDNIPAERTANEHIMEWVMDNPDFMSARASTTQNLAATKVSSGMLWALLNENSTLKEIDEWQKKAEDAQKEAQEKLNEAQEEENKETIEQKVEEAQALMDKAQTCAQKAAERAEKLVDNPLSQAIVSDAVSKADEEAQKVIAFGKAWGVEPGELTEIEADQVIAESKNVSKEAARIAALAGRLTGIASTAFERSKWSNTGPAIDPTYTKRINRLFQTEKFYLFSPDVPQFVKNLKRAKLAESGLAGFKPKSEAKEKGNIDVMVDRSSSMQWDNLEVTSKAIAIALGQATKEDKDMERHYRLSTFATAHDPIFSVQDNDGWKEHLDWAKQSTGGGTQFDFAFLDSIDWMRAKHSLGGTGCDLIFITDGYCHLSNETIAAWNEHHANCGARLHVIQLGGNENDQLVKMAQTYTVFATKNLEANAEKLTADLAAKIAKPYGGTK